jgi:nitroimidazol reductase NimA-like FMN-containing flavoprotein (pyridoxamine 5'-phosphate oxidase superfamily)
MRTKRMLTDADSIRKIIDKCDVCYVGMSDADHMPYVLPFNFGFDGSYIYLHSAKEGHKMDILHVNPKVSVAFSTDHEIGFQNKDVACSYLMKYRSVVAFGHIEFVEDPELKKEALNIMMKKYTGREFPYGMPSVLEVECYRVVIEKITGKEYGY